MDIPEILEQFERCRAPFPRTAVAEAVARREEITPEFLHILERVAEDPSTYATDGNYFGHIFAMFLLAKFRETRAYPIILHIVSRPGEAVFDLLGDVVTEDLGAVLASVSGGNDAGLKTLIENPEANEYVRSAALRGLVTLVATDQLSRDEVMEYFVGLFHRLPRQSNYVWSALANHCADLCPMEVREEIRQAYEDGLIERGVIHPHDVQDAIALGEDEALKNLRRRRYRLIDDVEKEMSWMSGFDAAGRSSGAMSAPEPGSRRFEVVEPHQRSGPKVGRNDPCPCGSGRKFKKCCGK